MKEIKIDIPEGYEIDKENSTFECIKFKPIETKWRDNDKYIITGYYIAPLSNIAEYNGKNNPTSYNTFATEKQAKSALAMARISQIMANDKRFGGVITDKEWDNMSIVKYSIYKYNNTIDMGTTLFTYRFLTFHTAKQRNLFLEENMDLVKDYLMIE